VIITQRSADSARHPNTKRMKAARAICLILIWWPAQEKARFDRHRSRLHRTVDGSQTPKRLILAPIIEELQAGGALQGAISCPSIGPCVTLPRRLLTPSNQEIIQRSAALDRSDQPTRLQPAASPSNCGISVPPSLLVSPCLLIPPPPAVEPSQLG